MRLILVVVIVLAAGIWAKRENYTGRQRLVGYWGQNGAGPKYGIANYEKPLDETCRTTKFDIIVLAFVNLIRETRDKDQLPAWNFANHCSRQISGHPFLLRCPEIENGIKECQRLGKNVTISVGGDTCPCTLKSPEDARKLAKNLYDLFLGGSKKDGSINLRPFGSAVLDGIDLDIESGQGHYYGDFIKEMRKIMDDDVNGKTYLLTAAPQCPFPEPYLGAALSTAGEDVDHLYIQFYNNYCQTGNEQDFYSSLNKWLALSKSKSPRGPLIFIGMPASEYASTGSVRGARFYRPPSQLEALYKKVRDLPGIGGIMLWDVSWDQNNVIGGQRYSEIAFAQLKGSTVVPTGSPGGNTAQPPTQPPATKPPATFSCATAGQGFHADPNDCHAFHRCESGRQYDFTCGPHREWSQNFLTCVWPSPGCK